MTSQSVIKPNRLKDILLHAHRIRYIDNTVYAYFLHPVDNSNTVGKKYLLLNREHNLIIIIECTSLCGDTDTVTVEPFLTSITAYHEPVKRALYQSII